MADSGVDRGAALARRDTRAPDGRANHRERARGNSHAVVSDPESLAREIERTRAELARTVDAIADRVSPSNAARRALNRVRDEAARVDPPVAAAVAAALVIGTTAFLAWRRRRR
jgi:Protein of unknown function (DUF3618)